MHYSACMNALAYQEDTPHVTTGEDWTAYLRRITCGLTRKEIAAAANINVSGVSRWLTGVSQPSTEKVIDFARSLNQNPLEALIAAGYLSPDDVAGAVSIKQSLSEIPDDQFVDELRGRLRDRLPSAERPIGAGGLRQKPKPRGRATNG